MRHRQDNSPSINFIEVPAHVGITATLSTLRVLLDAPTDLPLTQWQLAPLNTISKRLTGCTWQVVGCVVPIIEEPPGYPFIQHSDPPIRLQAWLWRTSHPPRDLYGDLRWHPAKGRSFVIVGPGSTGQEGVLRVWRWLKATDAHAGGRPRGPAAFKSLAEFEGTLRQVMAWLEKTYPTVPKWRIANDIHRLSKQPRAQRLDLPRTLRRIDDDLELEAARKYLQRCADFFEVSIDALIAQIWHDLHGA
jgi:hypothetical protein